MNPRLLIAVAALALLLVGQHHRSALEVPPKWAWDQGHVEVPDGVSVVVDLRPDVPGYDRSCKAGRGCVFGPAWTDDVDVRHGGNGCDQRSDVLRDSLKQIQIKPNTNGCVVASGILHDPYTGQSVAYQRTGNTEVVADHVVPLAAAWDLGASQWTQRKRQNFANDPRNLIITTSGANLAKGDKTPGEWMPEHNQCRYAQAYRAVVRAYAVATTRADEHALAVAASRC